MQNLSDDLEACCSLIASKTSSKPLNEWADVDFQQLSNSIYRRTQVSISLYTLKRIFRRLKTSDRYYPQQATRDALAIYAGFDNWQHLTDTLHPKEEIKPSALTEYLPDTDDVMPAEKAHPGPPPKIRSGKYRLPVAVGILLLVTGSLLGYRQYRAVAILPYQAKLVCKNPESDKPYTAIFSIKVPPGAKPLKKYTIDFGDQDVSTFFGPGEIRPHYYQKRYRYYAWLMYQGNIIDTLSIYLKTNDKWEATATSNNGQRWQDNSVFHEITGPDGPLHTSRQQLFQSGIDTSIAFNTSFSYIEPLPLNADNFELVTKIRASSVHPKINCNSLVITILGNKRFQGIQVEKPGCTQFIYAWLSDWRANGAANDLSHLAADLSNECIVKFKVDHQTVTIRVDEKEIFTQKYTEPVGKIYGINLGFRGNGTVYTVSLKDLATNKTLSLLPLAHSSL